MDDILALTNRITRPYRLNKKYAIYSVNELD